MILPLALVSLRGFAASRETNFFLLAQSRKAAKKEGVVL
jgi:hypothetical protein